MPDDRLVLLTSADSDTACESLRSSLKAWARAGLLGRVAWARAEDLVSHGASARCEASVGRNWAADSLESVASRGMSELWIAALRGSGRRSEHAQRTEDDACAALRRQFGGGVVVRSLTVSAPGPGCEFRHWDFSPMWDCHLLHDRHLTTSERVAMTDAENEAPLALCAAMALCASAGWSGADAGIDIEDRHAGPVTHPRIAHAQVRVLHAPDIASLGVPESPPWPAPSAAGVRQAMPGSSPPVSMADRLAKQCRFECEPLPGETDDGDDSAGLWRSLFGELPEPLPRTEGEFALRRLAERTGGYLPPADDGMIRLDLAQARKPESIDTLVAHIKQSGFPVGVFSAGAQGSTPETWRTVRGTLLGLVDGYDLPEGVQAVVAGEGRSGERLVWTDPSVLAPPRVLPEHERQAQPLAEEPKAPPADPSEGGDPQTGAREDRADVRRRRTRGKQPGNSKPRRRRDAADGTPSDDAEPVAIDEWLRPEGGALPTGGRHDALLSRLGARIDRALSTARSGFVELAAVRPLHDEHRQAIRARRVARGVLASGLLLLLGVVAAGLDQRWPYLAPAWEAATPWDARTAYGPAVWPVGWIVVGAVVAAAAAVAFAISARWLRASVRRLAEGERLRGRHAAGSTHFAGELLRLHSLREQFGDHRRILTEMLHRPFGDPERTGRARLECSEMRMEPSPPGCVLVGATNPSRELVDVEQKRVKERLTRRGWLTSVYREVYRAWHARYERQVLGAVPHPDEDASPSGTVAYRDHRDGRGISSPREDLADAVAGDGWAVREALRAGWRRLLGSGAGGEGDTPGMGRYLALLERPGSVHGPADATAGAEDFLDLGPSGQGLAPQQVVHRFSWAEMLDPEVAGSAPGLHACGSDAPWEAASDTRAGTVVLMSWRLEYSDQIPPEYLRGWNPGPDLGAPTSTGGVI